MKRFNRILLCLACAGSIHSCVTLTAEMSLPGSGTPGALSGKIGGSWSWPPKDAETLPADPVAVGKNPVLPLP